MAHVDAGVSDYGMIGNAEAKDGVLKHFASMHNVDPDSSNARMLFTTIKGSNGPAHMPVPFRCTRPAPQDINVYTDGSVTEPTHAEYALAGAGIWWPVRNLTTSPLHPNELQSTEHICKGGAYSFMEPSLGRELHQLGRN